jgi:hypothetical protein
MHARSVLAIAAGLLLTSCQPPPYDITMVFRDGGFVLEAHGNDSWPFGWSDDTIEPDAIEIADRDGPVWAIAVKEECGTDLPNPFPIVVGRLPNCFAEKTPFRGLRVNTLYRIEAEGLRDASGYFRIRPRISNLSWDDVDDELQTWPVQDLIVPPETPANDSNPPPQ